MRRVALFLTLIVLILGVAGPVGATRSVGDGVAPEPLALPTSVSWTRSTSGPAFIWDAVAFAGSTCRLVHFGGTDGYTQPTGTNLFDPKTGAWTTVAKPRRGSWPSFRTLARMAWDPIRQRVILFGGRDASGRALNDTWAFDPVAKTWTSLTPACRKGKPCPLPPARYAHGMAWSSALSKVVVYGGEKTSTFSVSDYLDDTWAFDGSTWRRISSTGPGGRAAMGMAEDATTGRILVYGGWAAYPVTGGISLEAVRDAGTWLLDPTASSWTRVVTPTVPEMRSDPGMAYLATIGAVVLTTGAKQPAPCSSWTNSVYAYDVAAKDWRKLDATAPLPTARNGATLTADLCDGSAILTGGTGDNQLPITLQDRTWILR
jgi:hypothetical protein